jgi:hypothetical protein
LDLKERREAKQVGFSDKKRGEIGSGGVMEKT